MNPFFSIIIPTYNRADFLKATLGSVLDQEYKNWECIVVDDGSTDQTGEVVKYFNDDRIRYFLKKNEERSIARNYGIEKASGKYICFLDSDDEYYPGHLQQFYDKIIAESLPKAIFSTGMFEKRGGKLIPRALYNEEEYEHPVFFIWEKFLLPTSVCIHHSILEEFKFPPNYKVWEDTHLWLRITAKYPFYQLNEYTCQWNVHKGGTVEKAFENVTARHVMEYLNCVAHLQKNYKDLLKPYLKKIDFGTYKFKKLKMFLHITFNRKQYNTFARLFAYGVSKVDAKETSKFVKYLLMTRARQKIHNFRTR